MYIYYKSGSAVVLDEQQVKKIIRINGNKENIVFIG